MFSQLRAASQCHSERPMGAGISRGKMSEGDGKSIGSRLVCMNKNRSGVYIPEQITAVSEEHADR